MDVLALILTVAAMIMFVFTASGRELRRFNEIALGLVFLGTRSARRSRRFRTAGSVIMFKGPWPRRNCSCR